jgi:rhodanese-related sulfurtransferase
MKLKTILLILLSISLSLFAGDSTIRTMSAEELGKKLAGKGRPLVVDVREIEEFDAGHIDGALLKPLGSIEALGVDKQRDIVLVCRSGRRSGIAYEKLAALGYRSLWNLEGGMLAWQKLGYAVVKKETK